MVNTFAPTWLLDQPQYWDGVKPTADEYDDPLAWLDAVEAGQYREGDRGWRNNPALELPDNVIEENGSYWQVDDRGFRQRWRPDTAYDAKSDPRVILNRVMQLFHPSRLYGTQQTPQDAIAKWVRANPQQAQRLYDAYDEFDSSIAPPFLLALMEREGIRPSRVPNQIPSQTPTDSAGSGSTSAPDPGGAPGGAIGDPIRDYLFGDYGDGSQYDVPQNDIYLFADSERPPTKHTPQPAQGYSGASGQNDASDLVLGPWAEEEQAWFDAMVAGAGSRVGAQGSMGDIAAGAVPQTPQDVTFTRDPVYPDFLLEYFDGARGRRRGY